MSESGTLILAVGPCQAAIPELTVCSRRGVRLIHVASRQDALLWVCETHPDIVLIDGGLADADPEGLGRQCRRLAPETHVIVLEADHTPLHAA